MSEVEFVDTHCHIDFSDFDADRNQVLQAASQCGVNTILVPSVSATDWSQTISICQQYTNCHLALGLHPVFVDQHQSEDLAELEAILTQTDAIAVGEIGLDYALKQLDRDKQKLFFKQQLSIAKQVDLPAIIHNRKAHDDGISMIRETGPRRGIIHAFNGSIQQAEKYIELGFLLGFGGMLTFARSAKLRKLATDIPLQYIVLETDAPDMTVQQHRGERNSPAYIPYIARAVAEIKNRSVREVAAITTQNYRNLFRNEKL